MGRKNCLSIAQAKSRNNKQLTAHRLISSSHIREDNRCADEHNVGHVAYHGVMQPACGALPAVENSADVL